jgi:preprotein translocase subunit YajC
LPAVPQQKKKEAEKPRQKEIPKGPKAGGIKPQVKKPGTRKPEIKKPEETKKETWVQRAAAPLPLKKTPG